MNTASIGQRLAIQGLTSTDATSFDSVSEQARVAEILLRRIQVESDVPAERLLATTALQVGLESTSWDGSYARVTAATATFQMLSQGVNGSIGHLLARTGRRAIHQPGLATLTNQEAIGRVYAMAIRDNAAEPAHQTSAQSTLNTAREFKSPATRTHLYEGLLTRLSR